MGWISCLHFSPQRQSVRSQEGEKCISTVPITLQLINCLCHMSYLPLWVLKSHHAMTLKLIRFHVITSPPVRMDIAEHPNALPNSCQRLGWLHTVYAALAFPRREWNTAPNVKECLRAFRALYCVAKPRLPLLIRDAQNAETSFWVARMHRASVLPLIREGGLELPVTHLPMQRPRGCIDFE